MKYLAYVAIAIIIAVIAGVLLRSAAPEPQTSSISTTLEDRCDFVMKSSGTPFTINENQAGTYNYEIYMRADGYVEVWECPKAVIK